MQMDSFNTIDVLGFVAGIFTTIAFIPQVIKTWNSKSAEDVSFLMFIFFLLGVLLWCAYGWEIHSIPVIIANAITFILALSIIILKILYEKA